MSSASRKSSPARYPCFGRPILSWRGETLTDVPADELEKRLGAPAPPSTGPTQGLLLRELGEENMRLGATCSGFEQDEEGRNAFFVDGSEERGCPDRRRRPHSTIRTSLFEGRSPATPATQPGGRSSNQAMSYPGAWGSGARFGCAHIGGGIVYWFATRNAPEREKDGPVGSSSGPKATLMKLFGGWHQPVAEPGAGSATPSKTPWCWPGVYGR